MKAHLNNVKEAPRTIHGFYKALGKAAIYYKYPAKCNTRA